MIDLIYKLYDVNLFQLLSQNNTIDLKSDLHYYTSNTIESLEHFDSNVKNINFKEPKQEDDEKEYYYADFEADTSSQYHVPYCCSVSKRDELKDIKTYYGTDCVKQLLTYLPDKSTTFFHYLGYDGRFIAKYGIKRGISKQSKLLIMDV